MTPQHDLVALALRVESGGGADRNLDVRIENALGIARFRQEHPGPDFDAVRVDVRPLTASLDAVVRLIEEKLPGYSWEVRQSGFGTPSQAQLWDPMKAPPMSIVARVSVETTPARALLAAALRAMKEEGRA